MNGISSLVSGDETNESSVLSLQSNLLVMFESMKVHPFFGGGLTSHRTSYDMFIGSLFPQFTEGGFLGLNQNDAGSIYILILSEFGLIGLIVYIIFFIKSLIKFYKRLEVYIVPFAYALTLFLIGFRYGNIASFYILFYLQITLMGLTHVNDINHKRCTAPVQL
jgi:O-antigen ligase